MVHCFVMLYLQKGMVLLVVFAASKCQDLHMKATLHRAFYILSISVLCRPSNRRGKRTLITQTSGHHGHRNPVAQGDLQSRYLGFGLARCLRLVVYFLLACQQWKQGNYAMREKRLDYVMSRWLYTPYSSMVSVIVSILGSDIRYSTVLGSPTNIRHNTFFLKWITSAVQVRCVFPLILLWPLWVLSKPRCRARHLFTLHLD